MFTKQNTPGVSTEMLDKMNKEVGETLVKMMCYPIAQLDADEWLKRAEEQVLKRAGYVRVPTITLSIIEKVISSYDDISHKVSINIMNGKYYLNFAYRDVEGDVRHNVTEKTEEELMKMFSDYNIYLGWGKK